MYGICDLNEVSVASLCTNSEFLVCVVAVMFSTSIQFIVVVLLC